MKEVIYRKRGRRYVPVGMYDDAHLYYPSGATLVWCRPDGGGALTRYGIDPAYAALIAASEPARDAMIEAMRKASYVKPEGQVKLTAKEQKAWKAYVAIAGERSSLTLAGASLHDIVDAGIDALRVAAAK